MKDQIQIIKSTFLIFNSSLSILKSNERTFNENIHKFNLFTSEILNRSFAIKLLAESQAHLIEMSHLSNKLNSNYDTLIDAVLFAKQRIIHPLVITPLDIVKYFRDNVRFLSEGRSFPFELTIDNAANLIDISELTIYYTNSKIIFVISITLTQNAIFNLLELIPLPIPHKTQKSYIYIEPSSKFLAISDDKVLYTQLNDLTYCKEVTQSEWICKNQEVFSTFDNLNCEVRLMRSLTTKIPDICNIKIIKGTTAVWHKLSYNKWIYILSEPELLTIFCPNTSATDEQIHGVGVITLDEP